MRSVKKVFLKISQNSQENTRPQPATLLKKSLWYNCFPVNFAKFLRTPFLQNTSGDCFRPLEFKSSGVRNDKSNLLKIFIQDKVGGVKLDFKAFLCQN